ncbi:MAG: methyltransferase domain-containing protein [Candidatus Coatesbacteria bacterium]|nr:methyltransferase domain-containing protein [Candidatus Coatesbacteria bacterium]
MAWSGPAAQPPRRLVLPPNAPPAPPRLDLPGGLRRGRPVRRAALGKRREFFARAPGRGGLRGLALGVPLGRQPALPALRAAWLAALGEIVGRRVLELGCGRGGELLELQRRGARVVGLELTPRRLSAARGNLPDAGLVVGDAERTPFRDGAFDAVITNSVLLHLDRPRALAEVSRLLAPGGRAVFLEPTDGHPLLRLYRLLRPRRGLVNYPDPTEFPRLARGNPLELVELSYWYLYAALPVLFTRLTGRGGRRLEAWTRRLARLDERLFTLRPDCRRRAWLVLAVYRKPAA